MRQRKDQRAHTRHAERGGVARTYMRYVDAQANNVSAQCSAAAQNAAPKETYQRRCAARVRQPRNGDRVLFYVTTDFIDGECVRGTRGTAAKAAESMRWHHGSQA